ncbi:hypothetical protein VB712_04830, partial [Spirulina sp. CCNP1310]|uniref:hypothetical protein n=1 Tax=Spirulina sp. CCNP1310 TaxID=3110249 RepID=UPI002B2098EA
MNAKPGGGSDSRPPLLPPTHATNPSPPDARPVNRSYSFKPIYPLNPYGQPITSTGRNSESGANSANFEQRGSEQC